jgi:hypothetical protein
LSAKEGEGLQADDNGEAECASGHGVVDVRTRPDGPGKVGDQTVHNQGRCFEVPQN